MENNPNWLLGRPLDFDDHQQADHYASLSKNYEEKQKRIEKEKKRMPSASSSHP